MRNFLKIDNDDRHLFGSDDVQLSLGRQLWALSDGANTVGFKALRFRSANQTFEVDSVTFYKRATAKQGAVMLRADKFFFTSTHIPTIYQKDELLLDSLVCVRPVLTLPAGTNKAKVNDTTGVVHSSLKSLFKTVNIRYTEIRDGEVLLANKHNQTSSAGTQKANLNIFNLNINPQRPHPLDVDSIKLNLKNIAFFSEDSLFKIRVESLTLHDKDVVFNNVLYGPATRRASKGLTFRAPALRLKNISLEDLLAKRLIASDAELIRPEITVLATQNAPASPRTDSLAAAAPKKTDIFQTLHSMSKLLQVERFHLVDARIRYRVVGPKPVELTMQRLNATFLLRKMLAGNSLVDIKHAIPTLTVQDVHVVAGGLRLALARYAFDGGRRHNWVDQLRLQLANGTVINCHKLYWEAFDWDVYQQTRAIHVDLLRVGELAVDVQKGAQNSGGAAPVAQPPAAAPKPRRALPALQVGRLLVERLHVKAALPKNTQAGFDGQALRVDQLTTRANRVQWAQFSGNLHQLYLNQAGGQQATVARVLLNSGQTSTVTDVHYADSRPGQTLQVLVPELRFRGPFTSSDFSNVNLSALAVTRPALTLMATAKRKPGGVHKAFAVPLNLALADLTVQQARVNYVTVNGPDSTRVESVVDVAGKALRSRKQGKETGELTFTSLRVSPARTTLASPQLRATIPLASLELTDGRLSAPQGGKPHLAAHLRANWTVDGLRPRLKSKPNAPADSLAIQRITGDVDLPDFRWTAGQKMAWANWVARTNLAVTNVSFRSATTLVKVGTVSWEGLKDRLQLGNFLVHPRQSKEDFLAPSQVQGDYITVQGELVAMNGFQAARWQQDSLVAIRHVALKNLVTTISRDKRRPMPAHLLEKLMPTRLIDHLKVPLRIDSASLVNSEVVYQERSKITNREGQIPLRSINGTIRNVTNRHAGAQDSLTMTASAQLLGLQIKQLHYQESYRDSLSGFHFLLRTSGLHLPGLNKITNPMAAAALDEGLTEPIVTRIAGNKYASVGNMSFYYKDLKVRLLDHTDTTRTTWLISLENFVIDRILRQKNRRDSRVFFARDRNKFVFNYWIKSVLSGVLTSVGAKGNKKYHIAYLKLRRQHPLPLEK